MNTSTLPFVERVPVLRPLLPAYERLEPYLRRIDANRTYSNRGPLVDEFETRVAERLGVPGGLVTANSGTAAIVAAILATSGRATDARPLAIVPAYTFVATALAAELCGYRPYVVDVAADDWMIDPDRIGSHPALHRAGVVIVVAPFGRRFEQTAWLRFRERTGVPVVFDAAANFDICAEDRTAARAAFGELPVALSFHATKSFATGEGGAVVTTDPDTLVGAAQALNFGFFGSRDCGVAAINGKMSEYHAAVGLAELDGWQRKRAAALRVAECYRRKAFTCGIADRFHAAPDLSGCYVLCDAGTREGAEDVCERLRIAGIGSRLWYGEGVHKHAHFRDVARDDVPIAEDLARRLVGLPVACDLSATDIAAIIAIVAEGLTANGFASAARRGASRR